MLTKPVVGSGVVVVPWLHEACWGVGGPAKPSHSITLAENKVQKCSSVWKNTHPGNCEHRY